MQIHVQTHWLPKRGNAAEEYEDAFWPSACRTEAATFRCAVSDGATEASFSREWARRLAEAFCTGELCRDTFLPDLEAMQADWQDAFGDEVESLAWYAEQKAQQGAFATLVGLEVSEGADPDAPHHWLAIAVGDSNLFQVRDGELIAAFPLESSEQFTSSPYLLSSNLGTAGPALRRYLHVAEGELLAGDVLYLMTDALACWFLACVERGKQPWKVLEALPPADEDDGTFADLVGALRTAEELQNDDVTFMRLSVEAMHSAEPAVVAATPSCPSAPPLSSAAEVDDSFVIGEAEPDDVSPDLVAVPFEFEDFEEEPDDSEFASWVEYPEPNPAGDDAASDAEPGSEEERVEDDAGDGPGDGVQRETADDENRAADRDEWIPDETGDDEGGDEARPA